MNMNPILKWGGLLFVVLVFLMLFRSCSDNVRDVDIQEPNEGESPSYNGVTGSAAEELRTLSVRLQTQDNKYNSQTQEITDLKLADWSNNLFGELNEPQPFDQYTVSIFELNLVYRFKQKYIIKGNKKQIIGSKFPELKLTYKKGIPNLFGSDVNFDFIEVSASDKATLGTFGDLKWNCVAGSFLNKVDLKFIEHKFFRGSDSFIFSNPLKSHQLLDSTFHTPAPYLQAFAIHHFNGAIMNKIPLVNKLKLQLVAGAGALFIQDINYAHIEFFGGIEKAFKIRRQLLKVGIYSALRDNNIGAGTLRFKIGMDFFNSYTNSWTY